MRDVNPDYNLTFGFKFSQMVTTINGIDKGGKMKSTADYYSVLYSST